MLVAQRQGKGGVSSEGANVGVRAGLVQPILQRFAVPDAHGNPLVAHLHEQQRHPADVPQGHNVRPVHPDELRRRESLLQVGQQVVDEQAFPGKVNPGIGPFGRDVANVGHGHPHQAATILEEQRGRRRGRQSLLHAPDGFAEAVEGNGFDQVVHHTVLVGLEGVGHRRGSQNDGGRVGQRVEQPKRIAIGQVDVEQQQVGPLLMQKLTGAGGGGEFGQELQDGQPADEVPEQRQRRGVVVDEYNCEECHAGVSLFAVRTTATSVLQCKTNMPRRTPPHTSPGMSGRSEKRSSLVEKIPRLFGR